MGSSLKVFTLFLWPIFPTGASGNKRCHIGGRVDCLWVREAPALGDVAHHRPAFGATKVGEAWGRPLPCAALEHLHRGPRGTRRGEERPILERGLQPHREERGAASGVTPDRNRRARGPPSPVLIRKSWASFPY